MIVKSYEEKPNPGGIAKSRLEVTVPPPYSTYLHYNECCKVCPNRMRKLTNVEACNPITFDVSREFVHITSASVECDHMPPKISDYLYGEDPVGRDWK